MLINDIKAYEKNAKIHKEKQLKQVADSIAKLGFDQAVVVDKDGKIIIGYARFLAAKQILGWNEIRIGVPCAKKGEEFIPVIVRDDLTDEEVKTRRLNDNKLNESDWDMSIVLEELKIMSIPMINLTGFSLDLLVLPEEKDDIIPEKVPTISKLSDIWQLGKHRMMCGDSTKKEDVEKLMDGKKADMVFTDPPYGVSVVKNNKVGADFGVAKKGIYSEVIGDDTLKVAEDFYNLCIELDYKRYIIWGGNYFIKFLPLSFGWIIWDKRGDTGIKNTFADGEMAWTNFQRQVRIYKQLWNGMIREGEHDKRLHPTQKPVKILSDIILEYTTENEIIFDGFLGSGSTLIACEKTNRICYGMEISKHYCDVILKRYFDYTKNDPIRLSDGKKYSELIAV